ncbi:hypothetical protein FRC17_005891 [Serendipita sp. 399]|nr:hypothetical protein FRC17_005891 [Serendipita sp. 399]
MLTLESVLQTYGNDPLVALEAVIQERNNLTMQNEQLWKLIEKQRSAFHAQGRELERLKASVSTSSPSNSGASAKERDMGSTQERTTDTSSPARKERPSRDKSSRTDTEDQHSQRHATVISRGAITAHPQEQLTLPNTGTSSPFTSSSRIDGPSLTPSASTPSVAGSSAEAPQQRPVRGESLPNPAPIPVVSSGPSTTGPLNVQKKSSLPAPSGSVQSTVPPVVAVPTILPTPEVASTSKPSSQPPAPALAPQKSGSTGSLGDNFLAPQPRDKRIARESRITLPDEAARYIAMNLGIDESPSGSPKHTEFGNQDGGAGDVADATIRNKGAGGMIEDPFSMEPSPLEVEVAYPAVSTDSGGKERRYPPPPIHAPPPVPTPDSASAVRETVIHGKKGGSVDYNDISTPVPGQYQLSYAQQQQQHHQQVQQQQSQSHSNATQQQSQASLSPQQSPPTRPPVYAQQPNGSTPHLGLDRPSFAQQQSNGTVSIPLSSPSDGPGYSQNKEPTRDKEGKELKEYNIQQQQQTHLQQQAQYRDAQFYDTGAPQGQIPGQKSPLQQQPKQSTAARTPQSAHSPHQPQHRSSPQLGPADLGSTRVKIMGSHIRTNERGKEVLSFLIAVQPSRSIPNDGDEWKIEKLYSDVVALDGKVRNALGRNQAKKLPQLPDPKLFKDNAPAKVDQRRAILEQYLQTLLAVPLKDPSDICIFFSSDISRGDRAPMGGQGYKEGYLTKRGKNFGGWKTRYFVLQNSVLEYFEGRGGTHLGTISITGAQIGRQQRQASADDENSYRHAFLIIEQAKKGAVPTRHVLCAASDAERDEWVDMLVRSVAPLYPSYREDGFPQSDSIPGGNQSRPSTSSNAPSDWDARNHQGVDDYSSNNSPIDRPNGQPQGPGLAWTDAQLAQRSTHPSHGLTQSADNGAISLSSSAESGADGLSYQRSNSSLGHHGESPKDPRSIHAQAADSSSPSATKSKADKMYSRTSQHSAASTLKSVHQTANTDRDDSSAGESTTAGSILSGAGSKKISGPMNAQPIPANQKFGNKEGFGSGSELSPAGADRKMKAGSRFWPSFGKGGGNNLGSGSHPTPNAASAGIPGRPVFGVPLEQALSIAQIANLPAIVFRCIEYLEAKKAAQEEGIYRLSGSSAVIKALKDRFNFEGDVNLLKHDEYWDPHAISGLLKQFLRDLPMSILTRELQQRFLSVIDLMDPKERVDELTHLVSQLPVANYCLLRAMSAHLILIVQNSAINKMTMRNVGIVFSPTLGIPAGILSLMLGEFDRVFNVDGADASSDAASSNEHESYSAQSERTQQKGGGSAEKPMRRSSYQGQEKINKRNSTLYANTATDRMLGLAGRKLDATEDSSDIEEVSLPGDSDTETDGEETTSRQTASEPPTSVSPPSPAPQISVSYPVTDADPPAAPTLDNHMQGAKAIAATRGLQISVTGKKMHRASGLPSSPRPIRYPGSPKQASNI